MLFIKYFCCLFQPAYSGKPKILEQGSFTKAAPAKEHKNFRHVSDSIGNNYSPNARHLTTSYIYDTTRFCKYSTVTEALNTTCSQYVVCD